ncbi:DNA helicase IV [Microbacteriaceae bacterium SG_E_30_P1]|uniref:DNA helicase IV n=1 Tax=Antiquaquibacter oligotrophicus TaxID=2880260 RepID=A0ABT6KKX0_9MICO|nr:UvrD-helicase domain-containing protein [Antiquaquibacter oligotrophicus]MDH6180652.1 DNA helicase IV [Antiquaquibacter oligotrophicus]UDF13620.1 AAA family ATPase [Antiquaquibacter oligotrophicus]
MASSELERERDYVHSLYSRLDELLEDARVRLDAVRRENAGGTHQNRSERDAFARIYEDRVAQLRQVDERLAFGRLTLADAPAGAEHHYIGRIGLRDDDQRPLLLDWRVPQARAFYQATAATPLGARARRHLQSAGRDVIRIDDEIFDRDLLDDASDSLQGEAALLATVTAQRTGRMVDIVATIQAEQDAIIRSELAGALVVQGGPGTGKTAVALHRAAYLLYSHRERLSSNGVLIVGPSPSFLQYIEQVLPSLGETGVVLASLGQLFPGEEATDEDAPEVAELKGSLEMVDLLKRAVRSRQIVPREAQVIDVNGERLTIQPSVIHSAMQRAWETRKPHNVARVTFNKAALSSLTRLLADQLRSHGNTIEDSDLGWLREDLRTSYDVRVLLNTAWLPLTPQKFIRDLYARPAWLAELTPTWSEQRRALLFRGRDADFTVSDIALLDEAAELLGEVDLAADARKAERKQQRKRDIANAEQAIRNMRVEGLVDARSLAEGFEAQVYRGTTAEQAAADREWTYGHIVVDEAQELSPLQWRVLVRRNPLKSFTIVGDVAQASAAAGTTSWSGALDPHLGRSWRLEELTVNYRTPAQVSEVAEEVARAHGLDITRSRAVREGEWPVFVTLGQPVEAAVVSAIREDRTRGSGAVAVIATGEVRGRLTAALSREFGSEVGVGAVGLTRAIAVLTPQESKGLEFDTVIVAEPQSIVDEHSRGASALYVAMTRATQRLYVVADSDLPVGMPRP